MAIDTYLKNKNVSKYQSVQQDGVKFLVAPMLARNVRRINVGLKNFLLWKSWSVELEPVKEHLHSPA